MADFDNTNRGALFVNDRKTTANHPDYKGSLNSDGVEYWASAWIKTPASGGAKFLSISLTPKDAAAPGNRQSAPVKSDAADFLSSGPVADAAARHKTANRDRKGDMPGRPSTPPPPQDFDSFDDDIPF